MKQTTLRRLISLGMLAILFILFTVISGTGFFNADNLVELLRDASVVAIVGVGVTYVIITSGIDLSTGSIMGVCGMVMANIYAYTLIPIPLMILCGILVGVVCGIINGFIVGELHVPEFIGTLATLSLFRALTYVFAIRDQNGVIQSQPMTVSSYTVLGTKAGPLYIVTYVMIAVIVIGQIILRYTRMGTNLYAIGANKKAAVLSGIHIDRTQIFAYVVTGICCAIGAVFTIARLQSATALLGDGFEFDPISAAVVGGVSLAGGSGDILGMLIGALFMGTLENGVRKLGINSAMQYVIKGTIIILVVIFDGWNRKRLADKAVEEGEKEEKTA